MPLNSSVQETPTQWQNWLQATWLPWLWQLFLFCFLNFHNPQRLSLDASFLKNKIKCSFPYYHFMVILPRSCPEQCRCSLLSTEQCQKVFEDPLRTFYSLKLAKYFKHAQEQSCISQKWFVYLIMQCTYTVKPFVIRLLLIDGIVSCPLHWS